MASSITSDTQTMANIRDHTLHSAVVKRWEDARDMLANSVKRYLDLCISLEDTLYYARGDTGALDITTRIDSTLNSLQREMSQQFIQSTSTLARTRNRLASFIWCLPKEVLSEIFIDVVYSPQNMYRPVKICVKAMYRNLHILLAVCSSWRNLALSQGILWETIPAMNETIKYQAIDLSIKRGSRNGLRLATVGRYDGVPPHLLEIITEHAPRICALNLEGTTPSQVTEAAAKILRDGVLTQLSELSIRVTPPRFSWKGASPYILVPTSPNYATFRSLVGSLSLLRLWQIQTRWESIAFSERLTELYIRGVQLGNSNPMHFLSAVSSANGLRDLKIIDVTAYCYSDNTSRTPACPKVIFPKLQSLMLQGLSFDLFQIFLLSIAPGTYRSILGLTVETARLTYSEDRNEAIEIHRLTDLLKLVRVDTLSLTSGDWLSGPVFRMILGSVTGLKELEVHGGVFNAAFCDNLLPPPDLYKECGEPVFSKLNSLALIGARISYEDGFKRFLMNIPTEKLVLEGSIREEEERRSLKGDEVIVGWLKCNISGFHLVARGYLTNRLIAQKWWLW